MPADPGNKTDETDLHAQHRAAVAGFGLCEFELESPYHELQLRARHRRNLVEKSAALACRIRDHVHLAMPGYADLFDRLFERPVPLAIARRRDSPAMLIQLGQVGLSQDLRDNKRSTCSLISCIASPVAAFQTWTIPLLRNGSEKPAPANIDPSWENAKQRTRGTRLVEISAVTANDVVSKRTIACLSR